jgi:hypothetical protein
MALTPSRIDGIPQAGAQGQAAVVRECLPTTTPFVTAAYRQKAPA